MESDGDNIPDVVPNVKLDDRGRPPQAARRKGNASKINTSANASNTSTRKGEQCVAAITTNRKLLSFLSFFL